MKRIIFYASGNMYKNCALKICRIEMGCVGLYLFISYIVIARYIKIGKFSKKELSKSLLLF